MSARLERSQKLNANTHADIHDSYVHWYVNENTISEQFSLVTIFYCQMLIIKVTLTRKIWLLRSIWLLIIQQTCKDGICSTHFLKEEINAYFVFFLRLVWNFNVQIGVTACILFYGLVGIHLKPFWVAVLSAAESPLPGKITFINGSNQMVRVHLSPTLTWGHIEHRTNETLRTDPHRRIGSNRVP